MKILLIGIQNRSLLYDLRKALLKEHIEVDLLDPQDGYLLTGEDQKILFGKSASSRNFFRKNLRLLHNFRKIGRFMKKNNRTYEVCNIHFLDIRYFFFRRFIFRIGNRLVISTYGTDFNKYRKYSILQRPLYRRAHRITFANNHLKERFDDFYHQKYSEKLALCKFGLSRIEELSQAEPTPEQIIAFRKQYGIPENRILVTIGYNSNPIHQQEKVLAEIIKMDLQVRDQLFFIFPMTYGGFNAHIEKVDQMARASGIPYVILKEFLGPAEVNCLRKTCDVMINLLAHDQLSATMSEYLYSGAYVITGAWLPYEPFDELGLFYSRIPDFSVLPELLALVIDHLPEYKAKSADNAKKIENFAKWSNTIKDWIGVYTP